MARGSYQLLAKIAAEYGWRKEDCPLAVFVANELDAAACARRAAGIARGEIIIEQMQHPWRDDPPTDKQLSFMNHLGYRGPEPRTKGVAHDIIEALMDAEEERTTTE